MRENRQLSGGQPNSVALSSSEIPSISYPWSFCFKSQLQNIPLDIRQFWGHPTLIFSHTFAHCILPVSNDVLHGPHSSSCSAVGSSHVRESHPHGVPTTEPRQWPGIWLCAVSNVHPHLCLFSDHTWTQRLWTGRSAIEYLYNVCVQCLVQSIEYLYVYNVFM